MMKAYEAEMSCNQLLIGNATQLLTINSPILKSVALMNLKDCNGDCTSGLYSAVMHLLPKYSKTKPCKLRFN